MTIWLIILPFGVATYAMRGAFIFRAGPTLHSPGGPRWLSYATPAVLAALVLPALVIVGYPLAPDTLRQLLSAGLAAVVAWRFQNVLATVASGMVALWGLTWLPDLTISFSLPLGQLLLASASLLLLLLGSALVWVHLRRRASPSRREGTPSSTAVTVTPAESQLLPTEAVSLAAQKPAGGHFHCIWCWCPLPMWALYCGQCGLPQQTPAHAITQPLAAFMVTPEGRKQFSAAHDARAEHTWHLPRMARMRGLRPVLGQSAQKGDR